MKAEEEHQVKVGIISLSTDWTEDEGEIGSEVQFDCASGSTCWIDSARTSGPSYNVPKYGRSWNSALHMHLDQVTEQLVQRKRMELGGFRG